MHFLRLIFFKLISELLLSLSSFFQFCFLLFVRLGELLLDNLIKLIELFVDVHHCLPDHFCLISSLSSLHSTCLLLENGIIRHSFIVVVEQSFSQDGFGGFLVLIVENSFGVFWLVKSYKSFDIFVPFLRVRMYWFFSNFKFKFLWVVYLAMLSPFCKLNLTSYCTQFSIMST